MVIKHNNTYIFGVVGPFSGTQDYREIICSYTVPAHTGSFSGWMRFLCKNMATYGRNLILVMFAKHQ